MKPTMTQDLSRNAVGRVSVVPAMPMKLEEFSKLSRAKSGPTQCEDNATSSDDPTVSGDMEGKDKNDNLKGE